MQAYVQMTEQEQDDYVLSHMEELMESANAYNRAVISGFTPSAIQTRNVLQQQTKPNSPWLEYLNKRNSRTNVLNIPSNPVKPTGNDTRLSYNPTDFSLLNSVVSPIQQAEAKRTIEQGLGLEGNALWNSPYILFENNNNYLV